MSLTAGTKLGPYEILSALGAGGMDEVYRARDAELNRDVAIKVLLPAVASDPDRLARFSREAQVLASLNHPNIAHIHGLEESNSVTALVVELVEGEDLSQRIARGPIQLDEALPIARQIAEAHEQGIIHRDLKPANIKVRPDGTVKVLDSASPRRWSRPAPRIGADPDEVVLTRSTTEGVKLFCTGLDMKEGDEVLMSTQETAAGPAPGARASSAMASRSGPSRSRRRPRT